EGRAFFFFYLVAYSICREKELSSTLVCGEKIEALLRMKQETEKYFVVVPQHMSNHGDKTPNNCDKTLNIINILLFAQNFAVFYDCIKASFFANLVNTFDKGTNVSDHSDNQQRKINHLPFLIFIFPILHFSLQWLFEARTDFRSDRRLDMLYMTEGSKTNIYHYMYRYMPIKPYLYNDSYMDIRLRKAIVGIYSCQLIFFIHVCAQGREEIHIMVQGKV
ncbi:hypothetical protein ACJX0J_012584, partial [Zea mays]